MNQGDEVIYCARHHEWLVVAGKWPNKLWSRKGYRGLVVEARDNNTAVVLWGNGVTKVHFCDNLEVV